MSKFTKMMAANDHVPAKEAIDMVPSNDESVNEAIYKEREEPVREEKGDNVHIKHPQDANNNPPKLVIEKRIAVNLIKENDKYMRINAKKTRGSLDVYFNDVIDRYKERPQIIDLYDVCHKKYKGEKERSTIGLTKENLDFVERTAANSGVSITEFLNHVMEVQAKS